MVESEFTCCEKDCRTFREGELLQLGYTGNAEAILFVPEWRAEGLHLPEKGTRVDGPRLSRLQPCRVPGTDAGRTGALH